MATVTSIFGVEPWRIGVAVLAVVAWAVIGLVQRYGLPKLPTFKCKAVEPAADPDRRFGFIERLHWLTEFARNDLGDPEMVKDLDNVHQKFTAIRETAAK